MDETQQQWFDRIFGPKNDPSFQGGEVVWHDVSSSNVAAIGYQRSKQMMHVRFLKPNKAGNYCYWYQDVPEKVFLNFLNAPSKGKFLWFTIRNSGADNLYAYDDY